MKRFFGIFTAVVFLAVLFVVPIATAFTEKNSYSVYENRNIEQFPDLNKNTFFSGEFSADITKYYSDNIVARDDFLKSYVTFNRKIMRKKEVNGVVFGDGVLLAYNSTDYFDKQKIDEQIKSMTQNIYELDRFVNENGGDFYYIGVPEQFSALSEYYPEYFCTQKEKLDYLNSVFFNSLEAKGVNALNMRNVFLREGNSFEKYSHIDHHFNYFGAFDIYTNIINFINEKSNFDITPIKSEELDFFELENRYLGSRNRKIYDLFQNNEKIIGAYPKKNKEVPFLRYDNGEKVDSELYKIPKDKNSYVDYTVYMGGDIAETVIDTGRETLPNVLLFGDSFTNPVETLLYMNFNKMFVLDLRHYNKKTLYEYIEEIKPDIVLSLRDDTSYLTTEGNGKYK